MLLLCQNVWYIIHIALCNLHMTLQYIKINLGRIRGLKDLPTRYYPHVLQLCMNHDF